MTDLVPTPGKPSRPTFLGIPIVGEKRSGSGPNVEQWDLPTFQTMITALIDEPFFVEWGWTQYTPYFNDGDVCVFNVHAPWIRTVGQEVYNPDDDEDYDGESSEMTLNSWTQHGTLGGLVWPNGGGWEKGVEKVYEGTREDLFTKAHAFAVALERGHFDNVVLGLFGDHCEVAMNRDRITIDAYSHD